jgi:hypothetical protein
MELSVINISSRREVRRNNRGLRGMSDEQLWMSFNNNYFDHLLKLHKGCLETNPRPGILRRAYSLIIQDGKVQQMDQEYMACLNRVDYSDKIENYHVKKFQPDLISLYECRRACQMDHPSSTTFKRSVGPS